MINLTVCLICLLTLLFLRWQVTMYMVLQGVGTCQCLQVVRCLSDLIFKLEAPMVWGPLSDHVGRRSISAACLFILTSSCIGLALVPTNAFWLLMFLRCIQASGSASTIALGSHHLKYLRRHCHLWSSQVLESSEIYQLVPKGVDFSAFLEFALWYEKAYTTQTFFFW